MVQVPSPQSSTFQAAPEVVISYSHDNRDVVQKLRAVLAEKGFRVWYDAGLEPGDDYRTKIRESITAAAAVIAVWSESACKSRWVPAEADDADKNDKLVQVRLDGCELPLPFGNRNCVDLHGWKGDADDQELGKVFEKLKRLIDRQRADKQETAFSYNPAEDRDELEVIKKILHDEARINVTQFIARGNISDVYAGQYGLRPVAVKAVDITDLSASHLEAFSQAIELASYLHNPTFLRDLQFIPRKRRCYLVTEFSRGITIARWLRQNRTFSVNEVCAIVNQLCGALVEAHERGLHHLRIVPSEIFFYEDKTLNRSIARIQSINFTYFIERSRCNQVALFDDDTGPFMAPELWHDADWFNTCMRSNYEGDELEREIHRKAHQFALGMVAWTLLEGKVPFSIPASGAALTRIDTFLRATKSFSKRVRQSTWPRTGGKTRALARIVARMVEADPSARWSDMKKVALLIGALAAEPAANQLENIVKTAYGACRERPQFYSRFYEKFFAFAPHARAHFATDMTRQHQMLDLALGQLLNYNQHQSEPTTLSMFVEPHKKFGLTEDDFRHFGEALIQTFDEELQAIEANVPEGQRTRLRALAALEIVIWPGIDYFIQQCRPAADEAAPGPAPLRKSA